MKTTISQAVAMIAIAFSCQSQPVDCSIDMMIKDLEARYDKDQEIRDELMPLLAAYQKDGSGKMKLLMKAMQMEKIDKKNQHRLAEYLMQCGWPEELSSKAHTAIFMLLQHAEDSLMRANFPLVSQRVAEGYLHPDDWATMFDRLQMNEGKEQRFGTQTFNGENNTNWVWPIESIGELQSRRDSVGLPDMETYFKIAQDSMGVVMKWDKKLTLEEAKRMRERSLK